MPNPPTKTTVMAPESKIPAMLLSGLENNIAEIDQKLAGEANLGKRTLFEDQKKECQDALRRRKADISTDEEFRDALDTVRSDGIILESLADGSFDQIDIEYLRDSDLWRFLDESMRNRLEKTLDQMQRADKLNATLGPRWENLQKKAKGEWLSFENKIRKEKESLQEERGKLEQKLQRTLSSGERGKLKERLDWIDGRLPLLEAQLNSFDSWWKKRAFQLQKESSRYNVAGRTTPEILNHTKELVREAQGIRAERIRKFLQGKFDTLKKKLEEKSGLFSKESLEKIKKDMEDFQKLMDRDPAFLAKRIEDMKSMADQQPSFAPVIQQLEGLLKDIDHNNPSFFDQLLKDLKEKESCLLGGTVINADGEEEHAKGLIEDNEKFHANRPQIESFVLEAIKEADQLIEGLRPHESAIDKRIKHREDKEDGFKELMKWREENRAVLANIAQMDDDELEQIRDDLNAFRPAITRGRELMVSMKVHKAIAELESLKTQKDILSTLEKHLGQEHIRLLSHAQFTGEKKDERGNVKNYAAHTQTGFMVFCERGPDWEVIIDRREFDKPENLEKARQEITHELLHLEFEKNFRLKVQVREKFMKDTEHWQKVKAAFFDAFPGKEPPSKEKGWQDDDILSELFAMQNEIGINRRPEKTAEDRLNNLLIGAGVATAEKIRGYEEYDAKKVEEKYRGAEHGGDHGGGAGEGAGGEEEGQGAKMEGGSSAEANHVQIGMLKEHIHELFKSEFIGDVPGGKELLALMGQFHEKTGEMNEQLRHEASPLISKIVEDRIKTIKKDLGEVEAALGRVSNEAPNLVINPLRALWNNTHFFSLQDIVQVAIDGYEFFKRRHERKKADHAARLGMALFHWNDLGREAKARQLKAEQAEVNEWKERYENEDAWKLLKIIEDMGSDLGGIDPSPDQLKAVLRILAHKGRLEWHQKGLWKVLNKLQSAVHLTPGDPVLHHNSSLLKQKLHAALGAIWDYDEYLTLQRDNEHGYSSGVKNYMEPLDNIQDQLTARMDQMLTEFKAGKPVDPQEYEACIQYGIDKGKSEPEDVMFHIMAGQALGLLQPDRGMAIDRNLNSYPATQWIYNKQPPLSREDYKKWCTKYFPDDLMNAKKGDQFMSFYWTMVQNDRMTIERVRKAVGERKWDHDYARAIAAMGDANTMKRFLWGRSGAQDVQDTAIENAAVGTVNWFQENAKYFNRAGLAGFSRQISTFCMMDGIGQNVAYKTEKAVSRYNPSMLAHVPREAGMGGHPSWNTSQYLKESRDFLDQIDGQFFKLTRNDTDFKDPKDQFKAIMNHLKTNYAAELKEMIARLDNRGELDGIFDNMDGIVTGITATIGEARIKQIALATFSKNKS